MSDLVSLPWVPSRREPALRRSDQTFRVPFREAPSVSDLSAGRATVHFLLRRPTPMLYRGELLIARSIDMIATEIH
jgi:hypothetical protein